MTETVLTWPREIDFSNASALGADITAFFATADPADTLVLDLGEVDFADSVALGTLLDARNRSGETGAALVLQNAPDSLLRIFRLTGIEELFSYRAGAPPAG